MLIKTKEQLIPELVTAINEIAEIYPVLVSSIQPMLQKFCKPWLEATGAGLPASGSLLTPSGLPFEFSFSSDSNDICYTAEPGLFNGKTKEKYQFIQKLIPYFTPKDHSFLETLMIQPLQCFGSWVSVRHKGSTKAFKVYQEVVPAMYAHFKKEMMQGIPGLPDLKYLRPMLLGLVPGMPDVREYYFKIERSDPLGLHQLLLTAEIPGQLPLLINALSSISGSVKFNDLSLGASYKTLPHSAPELTLFLHIPELFPTNLAARTGILNFVKQLGGTMPLYERMSHCLTEKEPDFPLHSIISIRPAKPAGKLACTIGFSPFSRISGSPPHRH
ncbi:hypothetical protein [Chryseobacterium viscerum]|uniref:Uncharacterized protein n=1 Tax=Chryseobacterium viscerum TaxID=1037377 RepID=A0A316W9F8_9FLAO|nr:hypothetical protein [Chryseobacterium viscerum]PWN57951.1 hypothetical protein C1634_025195 [Chryseobacterium viscerum]